MNTVSLPDGELVSALGVGTWMMGEVYDQRRAEISALRLAIELDMNLVDTAEMYGEGLTEELVGEALKGLRNQVFLVSKVYPHHASRQGVIDACERSLRRLGTDRLDLYLLHWRGDEPLADTVAGFQQLVRQGKIRHWGVSNFDRADMDELCALPGGERCVSNQILYNLTRRGPEFDLLPALLARHIPFMAYCPIEQGKLPEGGALSQIAADRGMTRWQVALAWVLRRPDAIAIPKATKLEHVRQNFQSQQLKLEAEELARLDQQFAPPQQASPLETI